MSGIRDIKRQIKSIGNTKKITRAMEMVAAAKMRKAIEAVLRTRTYANLSWETVLNLVRANGKAEKLLHPLLINKSEINRIGIVLITSNKGLCGGFNTAIINKTIASVKKYQQGEAKIETEFILMGKKGSRVRQFGHPVIADFPKLDIADEVAEITPIARIVIDDFLSGKYDKVMVAYTDFVSASKQEPRVKQLLPIEINNEEKYLGVVGENTKVGVSEEYIAGKKEKHLHDEKFEFEYAFEPSPAEVLDEMLPRLIEVQLYQALLESNASEHSARMSAMHQATEAAGDMISDLTLYYNKARQEKITAEIAEISAGANALADR